MPDPDYPGLHVRKLADKSGTRDPDRADPWPLLGVTFVDADGNATSTPPAKLAVPQDYAQREHAWIETVNARHHIVPSGPPENPTVQPPHVFVQADEVVFHMIDGAHRYRVVVNPGRYNADGTPNDGPADPATTVLYGYRLELVKGGK